MLTAATMLVFLSCVPASSEQLPTVDQMKGDAANYLKEHKYPALRQAVEAWKKLPFHIRLTTADILIDSINNKNNVILHDTEDLIIPFRIDHGDLKFQGHGFVVRQDLFLTGGRAAWAISELFDIDLPELNAGLTANEWSNRVDSIKRTIRSIRRAYEAGLEAGR